MQRQRPKAGIVISLLIYALFGFAAPPIAKHLWGSICAFRTVAAGMTACFLIAAASLWQGLRLYSRLRTSLND